MWKLEIHQLDVGQGDSAVVLFKKQNITNGKYEINKSILIDAGDSFAGVSVDTYLNNLNINVIDAVIISHFDKDHYKGLNLINKIDNQTHLFCPQHKIQNEVLQKFSENKRHIGKEGIFGNTDQLRTIMEICEWDLDNKAPNISFIGVDKYVASRGNWIRNTKEGTEENASSIVCSINFNNVSYIATGDIPATGERAAISALQNNSNYNTVIYKLAHHGSQHSTQASGEQIKQIQPVSGIISHGDRKFGRALDSHPYASTINTFHALGGETSNLDVYMTNPKYSGQTAIQDTIVSGSDMVLKSGTNKRHKGNIIISTTSNEAHKGRVRIDTIDAQGVNIRCYYYNTKQHRENWQDIHNQKINQISQSIQSIMIEDANPIPEEAVAHKELYQDQEKHPHVSTIKTQAKHERDNIRRDVNRWTLIEGLFSSEKLGYLKEEDIRTVVDNINKESLTMNTLRERLSTDEISGTYKYHKKGKKAHKAISFLIGEEFWQKIQRDESKKEMSELLQNINNYIDSIVIEEDKDAFINIMSLYSDFLENEIEQELFVNSMSSYAESLESEGKQEKLRQGITEYW